MFAAAALWNSLLLLNHRKGWKLLGLGNFIHFNSMNSTETLHREWKLVVPDKIHPKHIFLWPQYYCCLMTFNSSQYVKIRDVSHVKSGFQASLGKSEDPGHVFPNGKNRLGACFPHELQHKLSKELNWPASIMNFIWLVTVRIEFAGPGYTQGPVLGQG